MPRGWMFRAGRVRSTRADARNAKLFELQTRIEVCLRSAVLLVPIAARDGVRRRARHFGDLEYEPSESAAPHRQRRRERRRHRG